MAVTAAESAFSGGLGAEISLASVPFVESDDASLNELPGVPNSSDYIKLFSESNSRLLIEVPATSIESFEEILSQDGVPYAQVGKVTETPRLKIAASDGSVLIDADLADLKLRWQKPFDLGGEYAD